ncbi:suppressor of fused domain protein [Mycobacterium sp. CVI_P3]|uniref:Suppressor of fused domain protein n=1 Tax=Mycobacterium pinniadriaticum TaxID=2994102 RepID=A0ABT3SCJ9_9MYCO|nr:suppressor of fused domain protein [Mycobacterium pinniadriaticum]MCX2930784.1 suppressor of fused domain protein [Mycobacterium pinniadriaticum]MCX2937208.1 suppressor of fused domain protein [Mycobacterium pinniadriaticum]
MSQPLDLVRDHVRGHFVDVGIDAEPDSAGVTFLGLERVEVLRFGPDSQGVAHYVTLGCSRHPMTEPASGFADPLRGPRAEIVLSLRARARTPGLARSLAVVAATPAVEGVVLVTDMLIDLSAPVWEGAVFTAVLLGDSVIADLPLEAPREPVRFLAAVPITQTEAAWVRLKGAEAMRKAWLDDGVDVLDPNRRAAQPG